MKRIIENPKIINQGVDTLEIGVKIINEIFFNNEYKNFIKELKAQKIKAKIDNNFYGDKFSKTNFNLKYGDFFVSSKGAKHYFAFFKNDDIDCFVSDTQFNSKGIYDLKIRFRSLFLLKFGHEEAYKIIKDFLNSLFVDSKNFQLFVLRLDLCSDICGIEYTQEDIIRFRTKKRIGYYSDVYDVEEVSNIDENAFSRYVQFEGISFGKSPMMFRIYDKLKQLPKTNTKELLFKIWLKNGYVPNLDKFVYRHEAEFGRGFLKQFIPSYVTDEAVFLFSSLGTLWSVATNHVEWFDLTQKEINKITSNSLQRISVSKIYERCKSNSSRYNFWSIVQRFYSPVSSPLSKNEILKIKDIGKAKKALKTFVSSVVTNVGLYPDAFKDVFSSLQKEFYENHTDLETYCLNKICGNFLNANKIIDKNTLEEINPFELDIQSHLLHLCALLDEHANTEFNKNIKNVLKEIN